MGQVHSRLHRQYRLRLLQPLRAPRQAAGRGRLLAALLPHGFKAIPPGAPFFFRLGAPHKAIAGFGFFARPPQVLTVADESYKKLLSCAPSLRGGGISSGSRWQR